MTLEAADMRDAALMAGISIGTFVHLTFVGGYVEQGWLHLHDGRVRCCVDARRSDCRRMRQEVADKLYGGKVREYPPMDVDNLIRIDAAIVGSGRYTALWHDADFHEKHHAIDRERLVCCSERS